MNQQLLDKTLEIFIKFLLREGWNSQQALKEARVVRREVGIAGDITKLDYVRMSRVGALKVLTRAQRRDMQLLWNNATNHAHFALGDK